METRLPVMKWCDNLRGQTTLRHYSRNQPACGSGSDAVGGSRSGHRRAGSGRDHLTLSERLDRFDLLKRGGEVMTDDRISARHLLPTVHP